MLHSARGGAPLRAALIFRLPAVQAALVLGLDVSPPTIHLPERRAGVLDTRSLVRLVAAPLYRGAPLVRLASLPNVVEDRQLLDSWLLRRAPTHAATLVRFLCGVATKGSPRGVQLASCPRREKDVAEQLRLWGRSADLPVLKRRPLTPERSAIANRLGERCSDLLCSATTCREDAMAKCVEKLERSSHPEFAKREQRRAGCELWLGVLPRSLAPICDGLNGECTAPPDAYPGVVLWPSATCLMKNREAKGAAKARLCAHEATISATSTTELSDPGPVQCLMCAQGVPQ